MKRRLPLILGFVIGTGVGLYYLFVAKVEAIPWFVHTPVVSTSILLGRILMPNADPMAAIVIQFPLLVLYCAIAGALIGGAVGLLWTVVRRTRKRDEA